MIDAFLLAASAFQNPVVIGLLVGAPATILTFLAYRRGVKVAEEAKEEAREARIAASRIEEIRQGLSVLEGVNRGLQAELRRVQGSERALRQRVDVLTEELAQIRREVTHLNGAS